MLVLLSKEGPFMVFCELFVVCLINCSEKLLMSSKEWVLAAFIVSKREMSFSIVEKGFFSIRKLTREISVSC